MAVDMRCALQKDKGDIMREIKFRAWDGERKKMFCPTKEDGNLGFFHIIANWDYSKREIMQYIGLKDKNGVEIYEGDIIKGYKNFTVKYGLHYYEGGYESIGFYLSHNGSPNIEDYHFEWEDCEVIGNIYEK